MNRLARLDRRLVLQVAGVTPDGAGGGDVAWSDVATLWAEVVERQGRERAWAEALTAEGTYRIRIRYRSDVTPQMRFAGEGEIFDIRAVTDPTGRRCWLVCSCDRRPA